VIKPFKFESDPLTMPLTPEVMGKWALFLDLDGTLLDFAPTPDAVTVPPDLVSNLFAASRVLDGAVAIVSGRRLSEIDTLLAPWNGPGAGEHGAIVRHAGGRIDELGLRIPPNWIKELRRAETGMPGVKVEEKAHSVAVHFRLVPEREKSIYGLANALVASSPTEFEILPANLAIEIRARTATKARAVTQLMAEPPFKGRVPIYIGDDVTDEDGFVAARALGGTGVHVGRNFKGSPSEVRNWLRHVGALAHQRANLGKS
jgi:trehalose 6-phosphate phosphatase